MATVRRQPGARRLTTLVGTDRVARITGMLLVNGAMMLSLSSVYVLLLTVVLPDLGIRSRNLSHALATLAVAVAVVPLRERLVAISKRLIDREWQDAQDMLRDLTTELSRTIDPDAIGRLLVEDVPRQLRLDGARLWMLEPPDDRRFLLVGGGHEPDDARMLAHGASAGVVRSAGRYVAVGPADGEWAQPFARQGARLVFPLRVGDRLVGMYGVGAPASGGPFRPHVVTLLATLAPAAAGAIENARAYTVITRLNQQLRTLDKLKDEFIESVGHELRTPLTSLSLAAQLIAARPEMASELSDLLQENVVRLQHLIDRVLALNPSEEEPVGHAAVELRPLIEDVLAVFAPATRGHAVQLGLAVPAGLSVWADSPRLRRAIHEIVDNAVRYGAGGRVMVAALLRDGLAVVSVTDEGRGIPSDEQPLLFSAFYRGSHTRAMAATPGVGIGMSIARREVESIGGRIWVERTGHEGTTVCLALPAVILEDEAHELWERSVGE